MPPFELDVIDPTADAVEAKLLEAVATANKRCRVGKLEPDAEDYRRFLAEEFAKPEGVGMWLGERGRVTTFPESIRATLLGLAWWTSPIGEKHVKVVGRRIEPFNTAPSNRFGPSNSPWPALCRLDSRAVARTLAGGSIEAVAICACGAVGPAASIGWALGVCGPCHDHIEEHGKPLPAAFGPLTLETGGPCMSVAFSPSGKTLVGVGFGSFTGDTAEGAVIFWEPATGKVRKQHEQQFYLGNQGLAFVATGKRVFVGGYEGSAVYDQDSGKRLWTEEEGTNLPLLAANPDGETVVGYAGSFDVLCRSLQQGNDWEEVFTVPRENHGHPGALAFSPDGTLLASGRQGGSVDLHAWPGGAHRVLYSESPVEDQLADAVAFSPDGALLVAGCGTSSALSDSELEFAPRAKPDGRILLYDVKSRKCLACIPVAAANIHCVAFAPDGALVFAGDSSGTIWVIDAKKREEVGRLGGHIAGVYGLAFSPDGETLASAGGEGIVRLWPWRAVLGMSGQQMSGQPSAVSGQQKRTRKRKGGA